MSIYMRKGWLLLLLVAATFANAKQLEILEYYPACDYRVIENIEVKRKIKPDANGSATSKVIDKAFEKAKSEILKKTEFVPHSALVLTKKTVERSKILSSKRITSSSPYNYSLTLLAEHIEVCESIEGRLPKPAPIDRAGKKSIGTSKIGSVQSRTIEIKFDPEKTAGSVTINDHQLSFDSGVYGVTLGMSPSDATRILGKPSVSLLLNDGNILLGFGRNTWLIFKNHTLIHINNTQKYLNQDLINLISFDENFDNNKWYFVTDKGEKIAYKANWQSSEPIEGNSKIVNFSNETAQFQFLIERFLKANSSDFKFVFSGFRYLYRDSEVNTLEVLQQNNDLYSIVGEEIKINAAEGYIEQNKLNSPLGYVKGERGAKYLIYDNHLVARSKNDLIDKFVVYPAVFNKSAIASENLASGILGIKIGMPVDNILESLGGDVFEYGDIVEITLSGYTLNIYLDDAQTTRRITQYEVMLY